MRKNRIVLWVGLALFLALVVALGGVFYTLALASRISGVQTTVVAPEMLIPGGQAFVRAVVQDVASGAPVAQAAVVVRLAPKDGGRVLTLFQGRTDAQGTLAIRLTIPDGLAEEQTLRVETRAAQGSDKIERAILVRRDHKILLTTDKPLYQPGQTIIYAASRWLPGR
jgi:uncharacterized protein YfaS (alpha-2-macroglobulin family)